MTTFSLRSNFRPLCDKHYSEMMPMSTLPDQSENTGRCCAEAGKGCMRCFNAFDGYYDWKEGGIPASEPGSRICPEHGMGLCLELFNRQKNEVWRCPFCDYEVATKRRI
jgi:hypothetical protein